MFKRPRLRFRSLWRTHGAYNEAILQAQLVRRTSSRYIEQRIARYQFSSSELPIHIRVCLWFYFVLCHFRSIRVDGIDGWTSYFVTRVMTFGGEAADLWCTALYRGTSGHRSWWIRQSVVELSYVRSVRCRRRRCPRVVRVTSAPLDVIYPDTHLSDRGMSV